MSIEEEAPEIATCAVCNEPIHEDEARIETEGGNIFHAEHPLTVPQQDDLDSPT